MVVCLSCRHLAPSGSTYCPRCLRAFGARICPNGHRNGMDPQLIACATCGQAPLSEGTFYLPLRWVLRLAGLALVVLALRWTAHHGLLLLGWGWQAGVWALSVGLDVPQSQAAAGIERLLFWYAAAWAFSYLLPGASRGTLRRWLASLPRSAFRLLAALVRWARKLV